jgi:hypothetical protein
LRLKIYIFCIFLIPILGLISCEEEENEDRINEIIFCDAEKTGFGSTQVKTTGKKIFSENAKNRSSLEAFSGKYSMLSHSKLPEGFRIEYDDCKADESFLVEVWRKGNKKGVIRVQDSLGVFLNIESGHVFKQGENNWQKLILNFSIPPNFEKGKVVVSTFCDDTINCFFDDLKITRNSVAQYPEFDNNIVDIQLGKASIHHLQKLRTNAFKEGKLSQTENKWIDAIVHFDTKKIEAQLRFFAPELKYLKDSKWGYELKLVNGSIQNASSFYVYNPEIEFSFKKFIVSKFLSDQGILTTKVFYLPIYLNNESRGIYVFEEIPSDVLLDRKQKGSDVLVYFSNPIKNDSIQLNQNLPILESSIINTLGQTNEANNNNAQNVLERLRHKNDNLSSILNIRKTAKYIALMDVLCKNYNFHLIDQLFYFNTQTFKIEPVGFKNICLYKVDSSKFNYPSALFDAAIFQKNTALNQLKKELYFNKDFAKKYNYYLYKFANPQFQNKFFKKHKNELERIDTLCRNEFIKSSNFDQIVNSTREFQQNLKSYETYLDTIKKFQKRQNNYLPLNYPFDTVYSSNLSSSFISTFVQSSSSDSVLVSIKNYNSHSINFIGTGKKENLPINKFQSEIYLPSLKTDSINAIEILVERFAKILYFTIPGNDSIFSLIINKQEAPDYWNPHFDLTKQFLYTKNDSIRSLKKNIIHFRSRTYRFKEPMIIPRGYTVKIDAGCKIDFIQEAFLLSYSPIIMRGIKSKPVEVFSSDKTGQGIIVFNASKGSYVKDVIFEGLQSLNYKNWKFSGSLTFYNSNVEIIYSSFIDILTQNAVSVFESDCNIRFCHFENTTNNAINFFHSKGNIYKTIFNQINNNSLTVNASNAFLEDCEIENCDGIGIYSKQKSKVRINTSQIKSSNIAFLCSDMSEIEIQSVDISDCQIGFAAYQKKSISGPGKISTKLTKLLNVKREYLIEENSMLIYNEDTVASFEKNVAPLFYSKEEN